MILSLCTHLCTYMCMNGYKMYKLPEVVKAANRVLLSEKKKESKFIKNAKIMK